MPNIELNCPACATPILPRAQRRMNGTWGVAAVPCRHCGRPLQYQASLRHRLRLGFRLFAAGLLLIALWFSLRNSDALAPEWVTILGWIGSGIALAGIGVATFRQASISIEIANDTLNRGGFLAPTTLRPRPPTTGVRKESSRPPRSTPRRPRLRPTCRSAN